MKARLGKCLMRLGGAGRSRELHESFIATALVAHEYWK